MSLDQLTEYGLERMTDDQVESFLSAQPVGVLGLPADGVPYMLPPRWSPAERLDGSLATYRTGVRGESTGEGAPCPWA